MTSSNNEMKRPLDNELIARCLAGDTTAFGDLIDRHRVRLTRLLRAMLHDPFLREEVWQETLLRAYLNLEGLRNPERFRSWLCTIAINIARTQRRARRLRLQPWDDGLHQAQESPEAELMRQEQMKRVRQAIADLPPAEREAVMLVYLDELNHKEAAAQLGATLSAVKVRVHRGRNRLRLALQDEFVSPPSVRRKERNMIAVAVHDVLCVVKRLAPASTDAVPVEGVEQVDPMLGSCVILLKDEASDRILRIWIGPYEAHSIALHLKQMAIPRPLIYDLLQTLLALGEVKVESAAISRLHESTFYANLMVTIGTTKTEVDCRPSDAINLAVRMNIPIFVAPEIIEKSLHTVTDPPPTDYIYESLLTQSGELQQPGSLLHHLSQTQTTKASSQE